MKDLSVCGQFLLLQRWKKKMTKYDPISVCSLGPGMLGFGGFRAVVTCAVYFAKPCIHDISDLICHSFGYLFPMGFNWSTAFFYISIRLRRDAQ